MIPPIIRKNAKRYALAAASTVLTYLFLELLFPHLLLFLPLKTHSYLDDGIEILAQYSKKAVIPKQYIAIVGDSFAAGKGDWYTTANKNKRPAFHSAHVIFNRTGKDVMTFGGNGAGSLRGIVAEIIHQYELINSLPRFQIEPPQNILVYFYEGNDLNNNIRDIRSKFEPKYDNDRIYQQDYFRQFIKNAIHLNNSKLRKSQDRYLRNFIPGGAFVLHLIKSLREDEADEDKEDEEKDKYASEPPPEKLNKVFIDGEPIEIPDRLQSPALELTDDEIKLAVYVFAQSLAYLQDYFPSAKIGVVYIPSPLSSYQIASEKVRIQTYQKRESVYEGKSVRSRSNEIASLIEQAAKERNVRFIDSRQIIWKITSHEILHGPVDWKHFNEKGYSTLATAAVQLLADMEKN